MSKNTKLTPQTLLKESKMVPDVTFHSLSVDKTELMMFDDVTIGSWEI